MLDLFTSSKHAVNGFPMVPNSHFMFGHLLLMMGSDFREEMNTFSVKYADENGRVCFWMGTTPALSVTRPGDIQHLLRASSSRRIFDVMKRHMNAFLGKRNIGALTGKEWKAQRAAIVKSLHATVSRQELSRAVLRTADVLCESLRKEASDEPREVGELMQMLALDSFGQASLHKDFGCTSTLQLNEIAVSFKFLTKEMMRRMTWGLVDPISYSYSLPSPRNWAHKKHKEVVRGFIQRAVEERREKRNEENDQTQDLLTELLRVHDEGGSDDVAEETMTDTLVALLFAGFETTAVTLTFTLYLISQHPNVEAKILEEIRKKPPTPESVPSDYPYIEVVLTEALRLYPPAISTTRSLDKPLELDGVVVPEGTYLYIPIWIIQRDAQNFEKPETFLPERWLRDDVNRDAFVAFSAGARSCPGQRFAMMEMTLSLAVLLRNFKFDGVEGYVLTPQREGLTLEPKGGMPMIIRRRTTSSL